MNQPITTQPPKKQLYDLQKGDLVAVWYERGYDKSGRRFRFLRCAEVAHRAPELIQIGIYSYYPRSGEGYLVGPTANNGTRIEVWDEAIHRKVLEEQAQLENQKPRLPRNR